MSLHTDQGPHDGFAKAARELRAKGQEEFDPEAKAAYLRAADRFEDVDARAKLVFGVEQTHVEKTQLDVPRTRRKGLIRVIVYSLLLIVSGVVVMMRAEGLWWSGIFLAAAGAATLIYEMSAPRHRRDLGHLQVGMMNPTPGPTVPWWFVVIVLIGFFGFLYLVAIKHYI